MPCVCSSRKKASNRTEHVDVRCGENRQGPYEFSSAPRPMSSTRVGRRCPAERDHCHLRIAGRKISNAGAGRHTGRGADGNSYADTARRSHDLQTARQRLPLQHRLRNVQRSYPRHTGSGRRAETDSRRQSRVAICLDGRTVLSVPQRVTLADILLYCSIVFSNDRGGQPLPSEHANLQA